MSAAAFVRRGRAPVPAPSLLSKAPAPGWLPPPRLDAPALPSRLTVCSTHHSHSEPDCPSWEMQAGGPPPTAAPMCRAGPLQCPPQLSPSWASGVSGPPGSTAGSQRGVSEQVWRRGPTTWRMAMGMSPFLSSLKPRGPPLKGTPPVPRASTAWEHLPFYLLYIRARA